MKGRDRERTRARRSKEEEGRGWLTKGILHLGSHYTHQKNNKTKHKCSFYQKPSKGDQQKKQNISWTSNKQNSKNKHKGKAREQKQKQQQK